MAIKITDSMLAVLTNRAYMIVRHQADLPPSSDGPAIAVVLQRLIEQESNDA
jgi:hypothetical protein